MNREIKLEVKKLEKIYKGKSGDVVALNGVDLEVYDNEFISIVGPSGCGKSTLLNIVAGLLEQTGGSVLESGKSVRGTSPERGVIFQQYALFPWLTVRQNIEFGLKITKIEDEKLGRISRESFERKELKLIYYDLLADFPQKKKSELKDEAEKLLAERTKEKEPPLKTRKLTKSEIRSISDKYLDIVQLKEFANSFPKELSGGMKQRVAIARAYAVNPKILLLDEPFGALDAQTRTQLQQDLLETWEKERKTCMFITHDIEEAIILGERVVIMSARPGRIKEIVKINIPYPRNQETKMTKEFLDAKNYIWSQVYEEYLMDRK